jgi:type II secretory pathway pseudopilin PulG
MQRLMSRISRDRQGTTLIELVVVMIMIVIASGAVISIFVSLFQTMSQSTQNLNQLQTIEQVYAFNNIRLASTANSNLGLTVGASGQAAVAAQSWPAVTANSLMGPSLAGDQFVYRRGGLCYRVFYRGPNYANVTGGQEYANTLNVAVTRAVNTTATACDPLRSASTTRMRGPNQTVLVGAENRVRIPGEITSANPAYDPVLDVDPATLDDTSDFRIFQVAKGLLPLSYDGTLLANGIPVFTYLSNDFSDSNASLLAPAENLNAYYVNQSFNHNGTNYASLLGAANYQTNFLNKIVAIQMNFRILGSPDAPEASQQARPRDFRPVFYLSQVCPPSPSS